MIGPFERGSSQRSDHGFFFCLFILFCILSKMNSEYLSTVLIRDALVSNRKLRRGTDWWNVPSEDLVMDGYTPTPTHGREKDGGAFRGLLRAMMNACYFLF